MIVALLVCLIPTTIGGLLSAIGIAGMDRLVQHNVLAMSGRAVEAAYEAAQSATLMRAFVTAGAILVVFTSIVLVLWLGAQALRAGGTGAPPEVAATGARRAFREGVLVEAMNPKTAVFFIAFIPQFIDPGAMVAAQFVGLGLISVALNTAADVVVTFLAARLRRAVAGNPRLIGRLRQGSGAMMVALGASLLLVRRPV